MERQATASVCRVIFAHQTRHAIIEQLLDNHLTRRFQDRLEPQHDIEVIVFELLLRKRSFSSFDVNVDTRRVLRDALDKRGNHQEIHIVSRRDNETPQALRGVEFLARADHALYVAKDGPDWFDYG